MKGIAGLGIYQMRITLKGIQPSIWRRVQVPGTLSLAGFHEVQTVFGWTDTHLHQFHLARESYSPPDNFAEPVADEAAVTLAHAVGARSKCFLYVYDLGDDWEHNSAQQRVEEARIKCQAARYALMKHHIEHGC
jgi:hypothetical protein